MLLKAAKVLISASLLLLVSAPYAAADRVLKLPFHYADGRRAILLSGSVNGQPVLLAFDTSSPQTMLRPEVVGLQPGRGHEVLLELGSWQWKRWPVMVRDLGQNFSKTHERIGGLLGLDFIGQFSQVTFNIKEGTVTFVASERAADAYSIDCCTDWKKKFTFERSEGRYSLNGTDLPRISADSIDLSKPGEKYKIHITFLKTVLVSGGEPIDKGDEGLVKEWSERIPLVAKILKDQDVIGSLKPLIYELIAPAGQDLKLQEEVVLLWSANPSDSRTIGQTFSRPETPFSSVIADIQYRGPESPKALLVEKAYLQLIYVRDRSERLLIGALVIVSKPSGEFEFYLVPRNLLDQIMVDQMK